MSGREVRELATSQLSRGSHDAMEALADIGLCGKHFGFALSLPID